jgi:hypothetical protein
MRAGHTKPDVVFQAGGEPSVDSTGKPSRFDELAAYLLGRARRDAFEGQSFRFGPLRITLLIAPECTSLEMGAAFSFGALTSPALDNFDDLSNLPLQINSVGDEPSELTLGFTIYVLELSDVLFDKYLQPLFSGKPKSLQQLSGPEYAQQFIVGDDEHQTIKVFDLKNRVGLFVYSRPELLPPWEIFSPFKEFIHLFALGQSCVLMHGASLATPEAPDQGTLIVGPGGSGKSTLTAYAIERGMLTNGDDYVLLDMREDKPKCWSVYRTLKLHPTSPVLGDSRSSNNSRAAPWQIWRTDQLTGKLVMLAKPYELGGTMLLQTTLSSILGVSLVQSTEVYNPKANSILSDPHRHPYLHSCMSTIQQIPFRVDATLKLSKKLHQAIPYRTHEIKPGIEGLQQALLAVQGGCV